MNVFWGIVISLIIGYLAGWITTARFITGKWFKFNVDKDCCK